MRRIVLLAFIVGVIDSTSAGDVREKFDGYFQKAAASGYRNCGTVSIGGANRETVDSCVQEAFKERRPFFVRYDQLGIDSIVAEGLLFSEAKVLTVVVFDSWSCSTPYCASPVTCNSPRITKTGTGLHVQCSTNGYDL